MVCPNQEKIRSAASMLEVSTEAAAAALTEQMGKAHGVRMELFGEAKARWPAHHHQMFCQHDDDSVVLFRACCQHLGAQAVSTNAFSGSICFDKDKTRMMWFDTSYLVSMRKSRWGAKAGREVVLAIWIRRSFIEECLANAVCSNSRDGPTPVAARGAAASLPLRPVSLRTRVGSSSSASDVSSPSGRYFTLADEDLARGLLAGGDEDDVEEQSPERKRAVSTPYGAAHGELHVSNDRDGFARSFLDDGDLERSPATRSLRTSSLNKRVVDCVRLHWEPERLPSGEKHRNRRVVQLGLKGRWLEAVGSGDAVLKIERLDALLEKQRAILASTAPQLLAVPAASPFPVGHLNTSKLHELQLVSEDARPKLRILCLHGYLQNGKVFRQRTRQLSRKLKETAELVFIDAPHILAPDELPPPIAPAASTPALAPTIDSLSISSSATEPSKVDPERNELERTRSDASRASSSTPLVERDNARTWWRCDAAERRKAKEVAGMSGRCKYEGLEESLAYLTKVWDERGPFDGLLGFSQGAAMISLFNHCVFEGNDQDLVIPGTDDTVSSDKDPFATLMPQSPPPRFAVFISGSYHPHPTQVPSYPPRQDDDQKELPSLHVWAVQDPFVSAAQSQRLAAMYLRSSILMHRCSHCVPQKRETIPHFVRFLDEFR